MQEGLIIGQPYKWGNETASVMYPADPAVTYNAGDKVYLNSSGLLTVIANTTTHALGIVSDGNNISGMVNVWVRGEIVIALETGVAVGTVMNDKLEIVTPIDVTDVTIVRFK